MKPHIFPALLAALVLSACSTFNVGTEHPSAVLATATTSATANARFPTLVIFSPTDVALTAQAVSFSGTPTPPSSVVLPEPPSDAVWSPDGKRYATDGVIVDLEQKKMTRVVQSSYRWKFWGWLVQGRYAIFAYRDQYGGTITLAFDTLKWETLPSSFGCKKINANWYVDDQMRPYGVLPLAVSPLTSELLLTDGTLFDLPTLRWSDLFSEFRSLADNCTGEEQHYPKVAEIGLLKAAWSPSGTHLAVIGSYMDAARNFEYVLYVGQGNGSHMQRITDLGDVYPASFFHLRWTLDGQSVVAEIDPRQVTAEVPSRRYIYTLATGQIQETPLQTPIR